VTGVQDSTVKALVADLVPQRRLATAYGVFAAFQGVAALAGGTLAGGLYTEHRALLVALVAVAQILSAVLLAVALRHRHAHAPA
jgi:MFS family permease